jgi:hypothetical protein
MTFTLLVSLAICSSAAIPLNGMLIYHGINDNRLERTLAVFLKICQIGLSGTCTVAVVVALRSSSHVY